MTPLLEFFSKIEFNNSPLSNVQESYDLFMSCILKQAKSSEPSINEKIKFLLKDSSSDDYNYIAIGKVFPVSVPNGKTLDMRRSSKKTKAFEAYFADKIAVFPSCTEKAKFLAVNLPFETMLRANIIECINKICKLDEDAEKIKEDFEEFYANKVANVYIDGLARTLNKEILKFEDVDVVNVSVDNNNI